MSCEKKKKKIWFPAKRYGWGWGLPCAWQGWVVLAVWILLMSLSVWGLLPRHPWLFQGVVDFSWGLDRRLLVEGGKTALAVG